MDERETKRSREESCCFLDDILPICLVCSNTFSSSPQDAHAPIQSTKCGHTFCRSCILYCHAMEVQNRARVKTVPCMMCRAKGAFVAEQLHVNQSLIDAIERFKEAKQRFDETKKPPTRDPKSKVLHVEELTPIGWKVAEESWGFLGPSQVNPPSAGVVSRPSVEGQRAISFIYQKSQSMKGIPRSTNLSDDTELFYPTTASDFPLWSSTSPSSTERAQLLTDTDRDQEWSSIQAVPTQRLHSPLLLPLCSYGQSKSRGQQTQTVPVRSFQNGHWPLSGKTFSCDDS